MPRSMNPWIEFEKRAIVLLDHKSPAAFSPLLIVASCLLAIATILYGAGLIVRWRKGTLWFFRVVRVGNESFVLPHYVCTYSGLMICFSICESSLTSRLSCIDRQTLTVCFCRCRLAIVPLGRLGQTRQTH